MLKDFLREAVRKTPPDWGALLDGFRALGGTAENLVLQSGERGRGLFPLDPAKPVRLHVPSNLLFDMEDTEIRNGGLVIKASAKIAAGERAFFDWYQREFSWSAGVFDDLWQMQQARSEIPAKVRTSLPVDDSYFAEPTEELAHKQFVRTRAIKHGARRFIMPIVEFANHDRRFAGYEWRDGICIGGTFAGEVLVNYCSGDCWGIATRHGFCEPRDQAHSLRGKFRFENSWIEIGRNAEGATEIDGHAAPVVRVEGDTIRFSFVTLGNTRKPDLPRSVFVEVTRNTPIGKPDVLFDLIQRYNRLAFLKFLGASESDTTPLVGMLRRAAEAQMETISGD